MRVISVHLNLQSGQCIIHIGVRGQDELESIFMDYTAKIYTSNQKPFCP